MANNTLKARLIQASKTEAEWKSSNIKRRGCLFFR